MVSNLKTEEYRGFKIKFAKVGAGVILEAKKKNLVCKGTAKTKEEAFNIMKSKIDRYEAGMKPKVLRESGRQTLVKSSDIKKDKKKQALPPGKRVSKTGNVYYEYRQNRSDTKEDSLGMNSNTFQKLNKTSKGREKINKTLTQDKSLLSIVNDKKKADQWQKEAAAGKIMRIM